LVGVSGSNETLEAPPTKPVHGKRCSFTRLELLFPQNHVHGSERRGFVRRERKLVAGDAPSPRPRWSRDAGGSAGSHGGGAGRADDSGPAHAFIFRPVHRHAVALRSHAGAVDQIPQPVFTMRNTLKWLLSFCVAGLAALEVQAADASSGYPVDQLSVTYGRPHSAAPAVETFADVGIQLVRSGNELSADGAGDAVTIRLGDPLPSGTRITETALQKILAGLVARLNGQGIFGVVALPNRDQIDPGTKEDLRQPGDRSLQVVVWVMEVSKLRSVAKGGRIQPEEALMNPKHARILANSPLRAPEGAAPGDLFLKPELDEYLRRLNRHPGRIVEAALSSSDEPGRVVLDYLVNEERPWFVYGQFSNTGTTATDEFRERLGFVHNQLFNRDDILSIDLITAQFDTANAIFGSYSIPIVYPDTLRTRVYGSWGDFDATAVVGIAGGEDSIENFTGSSYNAGLEAIWSPIRFLGASIDFTAGLAIPHYEVSDLNLGTTGTADLLTPYLAVRAERVTDAFRFSGSIGFETSVKEVDKAELDDMGRLGTNDTYDMIRVEILASGFLEPLFRGPSHREGWVGQPMAHELLFQFRTQQVLGDDRMIPQKEVAVGGFFTVRGYPESAAVGDNSMVANLEYRFHLPRALRPASEADKGKTAVAMEPAPTLFGRPFNYRPPRVAARPDWDLILRAFIDYGQTEVNQGFLRVPPTQTERDHTLMSAGVGVEVQIFRNFNARLDWGYALEDLRLGVVREPGGEPEPDLSDWNKGDSRFHFLLTFVW
jgi:hypothetical protein